MRIGPARPPFDRRSAGQTALGLASLALGLAMSYRALRRERYSFAGRTAIVTGGSRGLGFELARQLAAAGARVWLVARSPDALERAAAALREEGASVQTVPRMCGIPQTCGISSIWSWPPTAASTCWSTTPASSRWRRSSWRAMRISRDSLATHFWGPLHLIRLSLPHLRRDGEGRILNISSIGGRIAVPHLAAYAAGKFALTGLSETLHAELGHMASASRPRLLG